MSIAVYPGSFDPVTLGHLDIIRRSAAIFDHADEISAENAKGAELSLENATSGMTIPFHKGAARYYAEHGITVDTKGE